jgi:hypothetical protein
MPYKVWIPGETLKAADLNNTIAQLVNTTADYTFTGNHIYDGHMQFNGNQFNVNTSTSYFNSISASGSVSAAINVADGHGNLRNISRNGPVPNGYTIQATDIGKFLYATGDVVIPSNIFNIGDNCTVYNSTAGTISVRQGGGATVWLAGIGTSGDRTLDTKGLCTFLCVNNNEYVISGAGLN